MYISDGLLSYRGWLRVPKDANAFWQNLSFVRGQIGSLEDRTLLRRHLPNNGEEKNRISSWFFTNDEGPKSDSLCPAAVLCPEEQLSTELY